MGLAASGILVAGMVAGEAGAQQRATSASAAVAACGTMNVNFDVTAGPAVVSTSQPGGASAGAAQGAQAPEGKALVYLVEDIIHIPLSSTTLRAGMDGNWVGATKNLMYVSFVVDPGVRHVCVSVQGHAWGQLERGITLLRLNAEAGKTYYLRARMTQGKDVLPLVLLDAVDEDEGQLLVQTAVPAVWHPKK